MRFKVAVVFILGAFTIVCKDATAQHFVGLSINYGDKLTFSPNHSMYLARPGSLSPTLVYNYQAKYKSDFAINLGVQAGITGYHLVPLLGDTITSSNGRSPFIDYGIFVSRFEITPGKIFRIANREFFAGLGGGVSYYKMLSYTSMDIFIVDQGSSYNVFSAYIESPESGVFSAFAKIYLRMNVSKRIDIALQYSRHWKSILNGEYEFRHTETPSAGTIKLVPQGISVMLLYRLKKLE